MQSIILTKWRNLKKCPIWDDSPCTGTRSVGPLRLLRNTFSIYDAIDNFYLKIIFCKFHFSDHIPQYRAAVISQLPELKSFDFSGVTKNDRFVSANVNVKKIRKVQWRELPWGTIFIHWKYILLYEKSLWVFVSFQSHGGKWGRRSEG